MGQCCVRPEFSEHDYDEDVGPRGPRHVHEEPALKDGDVLPRADLPKDTALTPTPPEAEAKKTSE